MDIILQGFDLNMLSPVETQSFISHATFESLFDNIMASPHHSLASMYDSLSVTDSHKSSFSSNSRGIARSRCERYLSALSSASSAYINMSSTWQQQAPNSYEPGPNIGWGYYVHVSTHKAPRMWSNVETTSDLCGCIGSFASLEQRQHSRCPISYVVEGCIQWETIALSLLGVCENVMKNICAHKVLWSITIHSRNKGNYSAGNDQGVIYQAAKSIITLALLPTPLRERQMTC